MSLRLLPFQCLTLSVVVSIDKQLDLNGTQSYSASHSDQNYLKFPQSFNHKLGKCVHPYAEVDKIVVVQHWPGREVILTHFSRNTDLSVFCTVANRLEPRSGPT